MAKASVSRHGEWAIRDKLRIHHRDLDPAVGSTRLLAVARGWYEKVIQGKAYDMRSLARGAGLTDRYVAKVFRWPSWRPTSSNLSSAVGSLTI